MVVQLGLCRTGLETFLSTLLIFSHMYTYILVNMESYCFQLPVQQAWTLDGKMTLQIANNTVRAFHPRGNTGIPQGIGLTSPQIRTAVPTIAVHKNGQVSVLQKQGMTKVSSASDVQTLQKVQSSAQSASDTPSVSSPQPQISFQVPLNWSGTGNNKSLLDSGKLSLLSSAQSGNQSTKPQNSASILEPASPTVTSEPVSTGYQTLLTTTSINSSSLGAGINLPPGMSLTQIPTTSINSSSLGAGINLPPGMSLTQIQKPVTSVTISGAPKLTAAKGGSFVLSSGNKVAFVPSSQVVTQIVKTDSKSVGKVTMAEAQIMLPTGPAKISWPVPPQTKDGKHILLTKQAIQSGPSPVKGSTGSILRPSSVSASLIASSKLVKDGGGHSQFLVQGPGAARPQKNLILKTQRSWELVKQAPLLLPKKSLPSTKQDSTSQSSEKIEDENKTETEKINAILNEAFGVKAAKTKESENSEVKSIVFGNESNTEQAEPLTEHVKVNSDDADTGTSDKQDKIKLSISLNDEKITEHPEHNNNEPGKNIGIDSVSEQSDNKQNSETKTEHINESTEGEVLQSVNESDSTELITGDSKEDSDKKAVLDEDADKLEPMDTDDTGVKDRDTVDDMNTAEDDTADFDAVGAMEWKDGVGELPGSDLKVMFVFNAYILLMIQMMAFLTTFTRRLLISFLVYVSCFLLSYES